MSYEIKTIYHAVVPGFEWGGLLHQGWYWDRETAQCMITNDGGARQGTIEEWEVVIMDNGDVLLCDREDEVGFGSKVTVGKTTVTKITVYGSSDEELRAAALYRLPDLWKKVLGLPYEEEMASQQTFIFSKPDAPHLRDKLLMLEVTAEEARVLGLTEDRDRAIEKFDAACEAQEEKAHA